MFSRILNKARSLMRRSRASVPVANTGTPAYLGRNINGKGNRIDDSQARLTSVQLDIIGDDNVVDFGSGSMVNNVRVFIKGNNNRVVIGEKCRFVNGSELWVEDDHCLLRIGPFSSFISAHLAVTESNSKLEIGRDCMFAYDIDVRTGDSHSIVDKDTGKRINHARDVVIGDHVWVAAHVSILKGVSIQNNSVVGTGSVVVRSPGESNVVMAGNPATIVKRNIDWDRARL